MRYKELCFLDKSVIGATVKIIDHDNFTGNTETYYATVEECKRCGGKGCKKCEHTTKALRYFSPLNFEPEISGSLELP